MTENCEQTENLVKEPGILTKDASQQVDQIPTDVKVDFRGQFAVEDLFDCGQGS